MWAAHVQGGIDGSRRIATHGRRVDSQKHRFGIIENEHAAQARAQFLAQAKNASVEGRGAPAGVRDSNRAIDLAQFGAFWAPEHFRETFARIEGRRTESAVKTDISNSW